MKTDMKIFIMAMGAVALLLPSCVNLDVEIYDKLSSENLFTSESGLNTALNGLYHQLRGKGWEEYNCAWGSYLTQQVACTDEADCNWGWEVQMDYLWIPETYNTSLFYDQMLPAVTKATSFLGRLEASDVSDDLKKSFSAQARCLRAIWAYDLYDMYGTVPIVYEPAVALDPQSSKTYRPKRATNEWYVNYVLSELKDAENGLKEQSELNNDGWGRMTKGIARMYEMKVFLHEAGQEKHYRNNPEKASQWWKRVDSIATVIIDSKEYQLQDSFKSIWAIDNRKNKEIIFPIPNFVQGGLGNMFLAHALPADYQPSDGVTRTQWGGFLVPFEFYDTFAPDDKRLECLIASYWNGSRIVDQRTSYTGVKPGAIPMKYPENPNTNGQYDDSDYIIDRYAEVILAKAEALNELNGPTEEAKAYLHMIRRRVFENYDESGHKAEIDRINSKDDFRDHILQERGWEFYWEGMRRPDLIRHGKLISNAIERGKHNAQKKHILYPIPQSALYENPNLEQNPDY